MMPKSKIVMIGEYALMATAQAVIGWGIQQGIGVASYRLAERKRLKNRIGFR